MLRRELCPVLPVDLVAVILLCIVAGGYVDTSHGPVFAYRKAELRGGAQCVKNPHPYPVSGHDRGGFPSKEAAVSAAVKAYDYSTLHRLGAQGAYQGCEALCRVPYNMDVHSVQTYAHYSAQAGSAKGERREESVLHLLRVVYN